MAVDDPPPVTTPAPTPAARARRTPGQVLGSLPLAAALTAAAFVAVGQAELPLRQFQQAGTRSFGVTSLGGGLFPHWGDAKAAVDLWSAPGDATRAQALTYLLAYTLIDLLLIACLVWVLARLAGRVADRYPADQTDLHLDKGIYSWNAHALRGPTGVPRPLLWFAVFDVVEDVLRLGAFGLDGSRWMYLAAWAAEKAKFVALLLVLLALVSGYVRRRPPPAAELAQRAAFRVLRGQVGIVLALSVLLLVDVTGQVTDFFRRWDDVASVAVGLLALTAFAAMLWASGRRIALPEQWVPGARPDDVSGASGRARWARRVTVILVTLAVGALVVGGLLAWAFDTLVPLALSIVLLVLLALEFFALKVVPKPVLDSRVEAAQEAADAAAEKATAERARAVMWAGRFLAAAPIALVGIVLVKAGTGPLVLSFHDSGYGTGQALVQIALGLALIALACLVVPRILARWDPWGLGSTGAAGFWRVQGPHLVAVAVVGMLVLVLLRWPIRAPLAMGSLAVVLVALGAIGLIFAELQRLTELIPAPRGLAMLGLKRIPVFVLLAAWFVVASALDTEGHHDIRTLEQRPDAVAIAEVWQDWLAENCAVPVGDADAAEDAVPMVFMIAQGGGIRAAYWTGSVLTSTFEGLDAITGCEGATGRSRVFALSSISGGSVGAAAYLSHADPTDDWYRTTLGDPD